MPRLKSTKDINKNQEIAEEIEKYRSDMNGNKITTKIGRFSLASNA